jgi:uncharacterized membrane protein YphA (DoxX/SURF4 family)
MTETTEKRIILYGRLFYAAGIVALGLQHFYNGDFVAVIVPSVPASIPGRYFWTCLSGAGLVITGGAIILGKGARPAAILLGTVLLVLLVFRHVPVQASANSRSLGAWTGAFKILTLAGGAFAVAASLPGEKSPRADRRFTSFGCFALAITCAIFGVDHFLYVGFVASLVPDWIPHPVFWTYFCGAALIAAGAGMILRVRARLASGLLGAMIFAWLLMLHIPRAIVDPFTGQGNEWTSVFEALAFSGIAFILSRTLPRKGTLVPGEAPKAPT